MLETQLQLHQTLMSQALPETINLEATNHCNLRCSHCGHSQYEKFSKGNLDLKFFEMIKPLLGKSGIKNLNLSDYGESFLSSNWKSLFKEASAIDDVKLMFITNGLLIHKHWPIFEKKDLYFNVSIDGASEKTYAHFRGAGYFKQVINNLETLYKKEINGEIEKSVRGFIVVLSRVNVHEMPDIVKLAHKLGFSNVTFTFQVFYDEQKFNQESLFFAQHLYDQYLAETLKEAEKNGINIIHVDSFDAKYQMPESAKMSWLYRDTEHKFRCSLVNNISYIKYHGQVEVCCTPDRYPVGSLNDDDFEDIWHGSYYRHLRLSFARGELTANCENCNMYQSVDVHSKESHFMHFVRDKGEHYSMPQPYKITKLEEQYQFAIQALKNKTQFQGEGMDELVKLSRLDNNFFEVINALGVCWFRLGDLQKAQRFFAKAVAINPEDSIARVNLKNLEKALSEGQ